MNDNKELNDNLQRLFSTIKDAYGISTMINAIKEKEVADKQNYEVLRMIDELGHIHFPDADGMPCLENCNIYSVKNLNNNEPFSIGDKTDEGTIKSFYIEDNKLWVRTEEKGGVVSINGIQKVKEPTFIWEVNTNHWTITKVHPERKSEAYCIVVFEDEDKAKEHVLLNAPKLSVQDIIDLWHLDQVKPINELKELAQSKIKNQ